MSFTVFDKFGEVGEKLDEPDRERLYYALMEYGLSGREVELEGYLAAIFTALKDDINHSKEARGRGSKGGRPKSKPEVSENVKPEVSENVKPNTVQSNTVQSNTGGDSARAEWEAMESNPDGTAFAAFERDVLEMFNFVTGKDMRTISPKVSLKLRRIFDSGRTVGDCERVVRLKAAQWDNPSERRFVTMETLFGDGFESYLNEQTCEVEVKPATCPRCGSPLVPIREHDPSAADPNDHWCGRCRSKVKAGYEVAA